MITKSAEKALEQYAEMMIETIKGLKEGWKQTWLSTEDVA